MPSYPDELLRDLNGSANVRSFDEQPDGEERSEGLIRVAYMTVAGAVVGGPFAVWWLLPEPPGPGEGGCGLEVLGTLLFGPLVGAVVGGTLGVTAGLLWNSAVGRMCHKPMPDANDCGSDQID